MVKVNKVLTGINILGVLVAGLIIGFSAQAWGDDTTEWNDPTAGELSCLSKVGIGTESPNAKLDLGATGGNKLLTYWSTNIYQGLGVDIGGGPYESNWFGSAGPSNQGFLSLGFYSNAEPPVYSEKVRIQASGKVGIGTQSPNVSLHNNGDFITKGPWMDVRAYGAVGDGTTDDTTAITNAVNATPVNGMLVFPPTSSAYIISSQIIIGSPITILGIGRPTIKMKNGIVSKMLFVTSGDVYIENIIFDCNKANVPNGFDFNNQQAIWVRAGVQVIDNVQIRHVAVNNSWYHGIQVNTAGYDVKRILLEDVQFVGAHLGADGSGNDNGYLTLRDVHVSGTLVQSGINLRDWRMVSMDNVSVVGVPYPGYGIGVLHSQYVYGSHIRLENNAGYGLAVSESSKRIVLMGVKAINNGTTFYSTGGITIDTNTDLGPDDPFDVTLTGIEAVGNNGNGLRLETSAHVTVIGGNFSGNALSGLKSSSDNVVVLGSNMESNLLYGFNDAAANTPAVIIGASFANNAGGAIAPASGGNGTVVRDSSPLSLNTSFYGTLKVGGGTLITKHLSAIATWDPPNITNGNATSTTVTVTGAVVGDTVLVGFSTAVPGGALLVGAVTSANTVTVTLANHGSALDLASGTVRADVWQH